MRDCKNARQTLPVKPDVRLLILLRAGVKAERRAAGRQHRAVWHLAEGAADRAKGVTSAERVSNMLTPMLGKRKQLLLVATNL